MEFRAFGMTPELPTGPSSTATISHVNVNPEFYDKPVTGTAGVVQRRQHQPDCNGGIIIFEEKRHSFRNIFGKKLKILRIPAKQHSIKPRIYCISEKI